MKKGKIKVKASIYFEYDFEDFDFEDGEIDIDELYNKVEYDLSDSEIDMYTIKGEGPDGKEFDVEP